MGDDEGIADIFKVAMVFPNLGEGVDPTVGIIVGEGF